METPGLVLLANEQHTQRAGAAVAGNGAAGIGLVGGLEVAVLINGIHNSGISIVADGGLGNEENIPGQIVPISQTVTNVHGQALVEIATVLLDHGHLTALDLDAGLQKQSSQP